MNYIAIISFVTSYVWWNLFWNPWFITYWWMLLKSSMHHIEGLVSWFSIAKHLAYLHEWYFLSYNKVNFPIKSSWIQLNFFKKLWKLQYKSLSDFENCLSPSYMAESLQTVDINQYTIWEQNRTPINQFIR